MSTEPSDVAAEQRDSSGPAAMLAAYRAEASGDLVAMSFPGARRVAGWLFWVVFPALCLAALFLSASGIIQHVGNEPSGIHGIYTAHRSCSRGICLVGGTFLSDDGKTRVNSLLGDPRWPDGTVHRVVYDGTGAEVVGIGQWDPTPSVMAGLGALSYLGVVGYFIVAARRGGRAA